jgi:hypothetical protein
MSWSWKRRAFKLISNAKKKIKMKQSREIITDGHGRCLLHGAGESRIYFCWKLASSVLLHNELCVSDFIAPRMKWRLLPAALGWYYLLHL